MTRTGEIIGAAYTLGDILGTGGMGIVYAAVQHSLGRTVAIKLPREELADDPAVRRRWRAEALAGSRIHHRNVVSVLDLGEHRGVPYLVMHHVAGPRLGQLLRERGPFDPFDAAELVRGLLSALDEAHAAGVLHDDVKSDNVLVETARDGTLVPYVIDFGLARFTDEPRHPNDETGWLLSGTPEYLAPERIRGEPPAIASDLYAVGIVLYELITGATPFAGGTVKEVMERHLCDEPIALTERCRDRSIPLAFEHIVRRALAKHPDERFATARVFRAALEQASLVVDPPTGPIRMIGARRRHSATAVSMPPAVRRDPIAAGERAVSAAIESGDADAIVFLSLDLVRAYLDAGAHALARAQLETAIALLTTSPTPVECRSLWRLQLTLAALCEEPPGRPSPPT